MILYLLLAVLVVLLTFISLGLTIYGMVKKRKKLAIGALSSFVTLTLCCIWSIYMYAKKSIDYMGSPEFQAETKKKAENMGKTWGNTVSGASQGLTETLDDEAIAQLANKSAVITGKVVKAVSAGADTTLGNSVLTDKSTTDAGIELGRAEEGIGSTARNMGLFLDFKTSFTGKLRLTAYDLKGRKQDVSDTSLDMKAGSGKVIIFDFPYATAGPNGYYILSRL